MSKELEELDELVYSGRENPIEISFDLTNFFQVINNIRQALQRLEQYDDLMGKYSIKNIKELEKILERDRFNSIGKSIQYCKNEVVK